MNPVEKALWFVENRLAGEVSLQAIARSVGVSNHHLARAFGAATGQSLMRYARGRRLSEAARSLVTGAPDILMVALDAGYGSHEAFTRAFREQFGMTPEHCRSLGNLDHIQLVEPIRMDKSLLIDLDEPRFEELGELLIAGFAARYTFDTNQGIPAQWQRFGPHIGAVPAQFGPETYGVACNFDNGGSFEYVGFAKYHRRLGAAVRMDSDGVYYLSFLFRRQGPPEEPLNAVAILFRTTEELERGKEDGRKRLNVGVGGWNQRFTHLGGIGSRTPVPLRFDETYLLVAKIVTSKAGSDQVFMRVYGPEEPVEREETGGWTVTGPPFQSDATFDWMEIHINSKTRQSLDEIRLGTTWSSVTAPWIGGAAPK